MIPETNSCGAGTYLRNRLLNFKYNNAIIVHRKFLSEKDYENEFLLPGRSTKFDQFEDGIINYY